MSVRRRSPTSLTPKQRSHACTEAFSNRGRTVTEDFMLARRHAPTVVAPKPMFSCVSAGVL